MNWQRKVLLVVSFFLLVGCGTVTVRSSPPEAEVSVVLPGKETPKNLGKTPYSADMSDLEDMVNEGTVVIQVSKRGYLTQRFVLPNLSSGELEIDANMLPNLPSNFKEINYIISLILKGERMVMQNRLKEAMEVVGEIKKLNENIATAYELEGTIFFLEKDFKKSRFAWIRALELEPNNPEAQNMLAKVEEKLGISGGAKP